MHNGYILLALCLIPISGIAQTPLQSASETLPLSHPFYLPSPKNILSETTLQTRREQYKNTRGYNTIYYKQSVSESIAVGLTDRVALTGTIENVFLKKKQMPESAHSFDKNIDFDIGAACNIMPFSDPIKLQVKASYGQRESWSRDQTGAYKYTSIGVKSGYTQENITSYVSAQTEIPLFQRKDAQDKNKYEFKIGTNGLWNQIISTDIAVRYNYDKEYKSNIWSMDLMMDWLITDQTALGIYGAYTFSGHQKYNAKIKNRLVGLRFKIIF